MRSDPQTTRSWLTRNVLALGLVSLLTDTASEMIVPLLPAFVTVVLGGGALALGWIEGVADALSSVLKLVSGLWADRKGRNRPFVVAGYSLASLVRPLVALTTTPWQVLLVRAADRTGKGLRSSPRDAILAASVPTDVRGTAFGFHRAMDHLGAVLGPLVAVVLLAAVTKDLRTIFWLSAIPGALAVVAVVAFVREAHVPAPTAERALPGTPGPRLMRLLVPIGVFTLGNASDVFLLLKAGLTRTPLEGLPLLWMGLHIVKSAASVPGGRLADRLGPRATIVLGWIVYAAVYAAMGFARSPAAVIALFLVYGLYYGLTEGPEKKLVASYAPEGREATTFGWYHLTVGLLALPASAIFGLLWDAFGARTAFLTGASLAGVAVVLLLALVPGAEEREV